MVSSLSTISKILRSRLRIINDSYYLCVLFINNISSLSFSFYVQFLLTTFILLFLNCRFFIQIMRKYFFIVLYCRFVVGKGEGRRMFSSVFCSELIIELFRIKKRWVKKYMYRIVKYINHLDVDRGILSIIFPVVSAQATAWCRVMIAS